MSGLFSPHLDSLDPESLPVTFGPHLSRNEAQARVAAGPSNQQVVDACKRAYHQHTDAVDQLTVGSVHTGQSPSAKPQLSAMRAYNWNSRVAAPGLATPLYESSTMEGARKSASADGSFLTFFIGLEESVDVFVGALAGVGVGLPFPWQGTGPLWMAYSGLRISFNIDVAVNLNAGIFLEPPSEVAGDYLGLELSAEPVEEGPSVGFGIHMSTDLATVRGFSIGVGLELGILPVNAAVVYGAIATNRS
ncbi:hypothetical protein [Geodermatophilus sp. URMC 64]